MNISYKLSLAGNTTAENKCKIDIDGDRNEYKKGYDERSIVWIVINHISELL